MSGTAADQQTPEAGSPAWRDRLRATLARHFGSAARITAFELALGGGSNQTWFLRCAPDSHAPHRIVLRRETYRGALSPFLDPESQYRIARCAHGAGIPVPEPYFLLEESDGLGRGFAMEYIPGETIPRKILRDPALDGIRPHLAARCGELAAAIHRLDAGALPFLEQLAESRDPIATQRDRLDSYGEPHPALEIGFRWLAAERRPAPRRCVLHGDFRNGNFLIGPDGPRAVLDWECCHLGDPREDLGWLCTRAWRFGHNDLPVGGFGQRPELLRAYRAAGGEPIEVEELRYWERFGLVRWAVINIMQAYAHVHAGRRSVVFAACGRNVCEIEYDLLKTLDGSID